MNKKKLLALINKKMEKRKELYTLTQTTEDIEEMRSASSGIESLDAEIEELRSIYNAMSDSSDEGWQDNTTGNVNTNIPQEGESRSNSSAGIVGGGFNPIATFSSGGEAREDEDLYSSLEYRQAFKNYVVSGVAIPDKFKGEARANEMTTTGDIGAIIPTTILNKVIEDLTTEGKILNRITQTSYQGGIAIPLSDIAPEATWLGSEAVTSDEQKAKMDAKITFAYHVLEAKVAISALSATVSLAIFEQTVVRQLKKSMTRALETSIVSGTGSGSPTGFLSTDVPEKNKLTMHPVEIGTVAGWAEVEASVDEEVEDSLVYMMSKATWEKYLNGMVDKNGQKIGLGKINEKGEKILNGREVMTSNKLPSFDAAKEGEVFAVLVDLKQYLLNSNLSMYYKKYFNEDTNKWIHKSLLIADGKMCIGTTTAGNIVGAQSLLKIQKGAALSQAQIKKIKEMESEIEA